MPPGYDQQAEIITSWFGENTQWYLSGHLLAGHAFLLFYFPFYAGLCERLRHAEGNTAVWSRVAWAGAIMSPAAGTTAGSFIVGAALPESNLPAVVVQFGIAANFYAYVVSGALGGVAAIGASIVILQTGVFKRWLGWTGLLIGGTAICSTAAVLENDPGGLFATINGLAWLAYFLWIGALSVELIKIPGRFPPSD